MGVVIPLKQKQKVRKEIGELDLDELLSQAVIMRKKIFGQVENDIFILKADISDLLRSRIGNELITRKKISAEIFQCGLYVSNLLADLIGKVPESYWASDYLIRGIEEEKPEVVKEGADLCAVVCIFFDDDQLKKVIRKRKYDYFGSLLYLRYYHQTGKPIAWHMSNNFNEITAIARNSIQSL